MGVCVSLGIVSGTYGTTTGVMMGYECGRGLKEDSSGEGGERERASASCARAHVRP